MIALIYIYAIKSFDLICFVSSYEAHYYTSPKPVHLIQ